MKKRLVSVLLFALVVSAGAAFVLYQLISTKVSASQPTQTTPMVKIYVATKNIETGALVKEPDLQLVDWPAERATGTITKKEDLVGRGAASPIQQGWPISENMLTPKGAGAGFASTIPKGMRAFALHVNEVVGVAGFAITGMRVDILVSGSVPGVQSATGPITRTLLQNIEILSAGQNYQKDAEGKPILVQVVNVLVTPEQAEILNLATDQRIQLVLRNPTDREVTKTSGASTSALFGGNKFEAPENALPKMATPLRVASADPKPVRRKADTVRPEGPPPVPQMVTVEVFAGSKKVESTFQNPEAKR